MMKKAIFIVLAVIGTIFINISGVNAEKISTYDGFARCVYGGEVIEQKGPVEWKAMVYVVIRIYRDTDNVVRAYGNMLSTKGYTDQGIVISDEFHIDISNYNDLFHHANDELLVHYRHTSWFCNPQVHVKLENIENPSSAKLSMFPSSGYSSIPLSKDYSSFSNEPTIFDSNDDVTDDFPNIRSEAWENHLEDQQEAYENISGVETEKIDEGIIQSILDWAGLESSTRYELNEVDPCAIISGDIQQLLHTVFLFISVAGIIILIVMTIISVVKVITASEDDALSNFLKGLWKRIICLIILLLLPVIVTFLIQVVNGAGAIWGVNSDNPLCNITK